MSEIIRVFNIDPQSASRPIVSKYGVRYSKNYTAFRKAFKMIVMANKQDELRGTLSATILFYIAMPKSWSKKKREEHRKQLHTSKPDIDNLAKAVLDGVSGQYFRDDSQIAILHTQKYWAETGKISLILKEVR